MKLIEFFKVYIVYPSIFIFENFIRVFNSNKGTIDIVKDDSSYNWQANNFHLDELPARLFGSERLGSYNTPFEDADRFLVALEYFELGQCIADGRKPEVAAYIGRKDLAVCNAALESSILGRSVTIEEIENEKTSVYESSINDHWKI